LKVKYRSKITNRTAKQTPAGVIACALPCMFALPMDV